MFIANHVMINVIDYLWSSLYPFEYPIFMFNESYMVNKNNILFCMSDTID